MLKYTRKIGQNPDTKQIYTVETEYRIEGVADPVGCIFLSRERGFCWGYKGAGLADSRTCTPSFESPVGPDNESIINAYNGVMKELEAWLITEYQIPE